jgi:hypothetical protein
VVSQVFPRRNHALFDIGLVSLFQSYRDALRYPNHSFCAVGHLDAGNSALRI